MVRQIWSIVRCGMLSLGIAAGIGGCTSGNLLGEPGLYAYKGAAAQQADTAVGRMFRPEASHLDLDRAKATPDRMERLRIFVDQSEVEDVSRMSIAYSSEELRKLLDKAAQESSTQFGRFERVSDKSKAQLVIRARLYTVSVWADTKVEDNSGGSNGNAGAVATAAALQTINREGLDAYVTVLFCHPDNTEFASGRALGRLVGTRGTAVVSGTYKNQQNTGASGKRSLTVENAKVKDSDMSRVLAVAVDGAIAVALEAQLERELWEDRAGADGVRHMRSTGASANSTGTETAKLR